MKPQRFAQLDALRGIALFGILMVNTPFFFMPEGNFGTYALQNFPGWPNRAAEFLTSWLFDGKFILIFSFLFGWGLHTQMSRGDGFAPRYFRRLLGLFVIGLIHAVFLFVGDILVTYALLGLPLYFMRNWPVRRLVTGAGAFWAVSVVTQAALGLALMAFPESFADYASIVALHQTGGFWQIVDNRIEDLIALYIVTPFLFAPEVLGMFMLGLATARSYGTQPGLDGLKPLARQVLMWLWLPALALNALYAIASNTLLFNAVVALGMRGAVVPLLTLVYLSAALFIFDHPRADKVARILGGEGQMSLSIYIGESIVMGFIALSYGLSLYGKVSPAQGVLLCIAVYAALLWLAALWRRFFSLGPCEWLLRTITGARPVNIARPAGN